MTQTERDRAEKAAVEYAEKTISKMRGFKVDDLSWTDSLYGKELRISYDGYWAGYEQAMKDWASANSSKNSNL